MRSELSRNSELKAALKKGDASKRVASWTWKAVLVSPTSKVTVATSAHLKGISRQTNYRNSIMYAYLALAGCATAILKELSGGVDERS